MDVLTPAGVVQSDELTFVAHAVVLQPVLIPVIHFHGLAAAWAGPDPVRGQPHWLLPVVLGRLLTWHRLSAQRTLMVARH